MEKMYNRVILKDTEDVLVLKSKLLPEGWEWTYYKEDGSGSLRGPGCINYRSFFAFDLTTREYVYGESTLGTHRMWRHISSNVGLEDIMDMGEAWVKAHIIDIEG